MTQIIIFAIVVIVVFLTRKIWSRYLVLLFSKSRKPLAVSNTQEGVVFQPSGTKRMFVIAIEIEEKGDGTAKISLAKLKDSEV